MAPTTRRSRVQLLSDHEQPPKIADQEPNYPSVLPNPESNNIQPVVNEITQLDELKSSFEPPLLSEDKVAAASSVTKSVKGKELARARQTTTTKLEATSVPYVSPSPLPRTSSKRPMLPEISDGSDKENESPSDEFIRAKARENREALYAEGRRTLGEAIEQIREAGRSRRASSVLGPPTSSSINPFLVPSDNGTGFPILDRVMNDLDLSVKAYWIGHPETIEENCQWVQDGFKPNFTLRYKEDATVKPESYEPNAPAIIGWIGRVSADGSTITPEAGYNVNFDSGDISKRKWVVAVSQPQPEMQIPRVFWSSQMDGAKAFIDYGRHAIEGNKPLDVGHSFFDNIIGGLRVRSPVFLPYYIPVPDSDDQDNIEVPEREADVPPEFRFATWRFPSPSVRTAFCGVIDRGFDPQLLEAYDGRDERIHINNVQAMLANSVVCVFCTMEKTLFRGKSQPNGKAWQFYANLVKVQVLKRPMAIAPMPRKRRIIKGYTEGGDNGHRATRPRLV
ncbi:hypothetical protein RSOLAG1IB_10354 [Rhizoctonia solani AG-1 IB]|uniref:Uncharacterized protein n=1 Tax=Thanatephorus cucumeris (strain AG1-IB / isolate 7/3/14) TaxID=1108050 RepID=M5C8E2_THACB|nr:hypothetical protein BN14_09712 [Rhizoctonia solani AG-1 IB]CEL62290.1 hypothetical protein RSOLAG1IB_10354 [Rhizoctonia solani AG-1 IB]